MGTESEEAAARAELERVRTENAIKQMQRDEEMRKLREQQEGKMVADQPSGVGWPDNEVSAPGGPVTAIAGKLGIGKAGDVALAKQLLDAERRPGGPAPASGGDGARTRAAGAFTRPATPAVER